MKGYFGRAWLALALGAPAAAEPPLGEVGWRRLEFGASKFLLSATTTVTLKRVRAEEANLELRAVPEGEAVPVAEPEVLFLTVDSELPFGRREHTAVWLLPASGAALQNYKLVTGRKPYEKVLRYTTAGFYMWRAAPGRAAEEKLGPEGWSRRRAKHVRAAWPLPPDAWLTDAYALLFLASAARLERPGAGLRAFLLADERPVELRFTSGGLVQSQLEFHEQGSNGSRRRKQQLLQRIVTVSAHPIGNESTGGEVDLGFLGLRGALRLFLDAATGLPVQIQGRADTVGELWVTLRRVTWAGPLPATRAGAEETPDSTGRLEGDGGSTLTAALWVRL